MTKEDLIEAYATWLGHYHWHWFGTLTFRRPVSTFVAEQIYGRWISEVKDAQGTDAFSWIRVTERGAYGDNLHFHILVSGLRDVYKWDWILRWDQLAGTADIFYYNKNAGGLRYMLKEVQPRGDFEMYLEISESIVELK